MSAAVTPHTAAISEIESIPPYYLAGAASEKTSRRRHAAVRTRWSPAVVQTRPRGIKSRAIDGWVAGSRVSLPPLQPRAGIPTDQQSNVPKDKVHIVGIGDDGLDGVTSTARDLIEQADLLVGADYTLAIGAGSR